MTRNFPAVLAVMIAVGALLAITFAPLAVASGIPVCVFRLATGRPCLFCGLTHAVIYAMQGQWSAAAQANQLWFVLVPMTILVAAMIVTRRRAPAWTLIILIVAGTITRAYVL